MKNLAILVAIVTVFTTIISFFLFVSFTHLGVVTLTDRHEVCVDSMEVIEGTGEVACKFPEQEIQVASLEGVFIHELVKCVCRRTSQSQTDGGAG